MNAAEIGSVGGQGKDARVLQHLLGHWAQARPEAPFVRCASGWITFAAMNQRSDRVAAGLAGLGLRRGDRVAVALPNCDEILVLIFALAKLGAVQVPLNVFLKGDFLRHQLKDSGARVLVTDAAGLAAAAPIVGETDLEAVVLTERAAETPLPATVFADLERSVAPVLPDEARPQDIVSIMYTSGTTGMPKGCLLSHGYYTLIPTAYVEAGWVDPADRIFSAMPLFHAAGQAIVLMCALTQGSSAVFEPAFSASTFMARAREEEATMLFGVAAMGMAILAQPRGNDEPRGFRMSTWIPMSAEKQAEFEERFATPVICEGFGQTECAPAMLNNIDGNRRPGSSGVPVSYLDVKVVDEFDQEVGVGEVGEIVIRPNRPLAMYSGYWRNGDATVDAWRNLWHHTGDTARRDGDGYFFFVDRKKDAMRRRGENVSSLEVEAAIMRHPKVAQCAVHAVPSKMGEDDIKVCIVPAGGAAPTPEELFEFFRAELPYFAIPGYVELLDGLPANAMGRVQKHLLRERPFTEDTWDLAALGFSVGRDERR